MDAGDTNCSSGSVSNHVLGLNGVGRRRDSGSIVDKPNNKMSITSFLKASLFTVTVITCNPFGAGAAQTNAVQSINLALNLITQGAFKTNSPTTNHITSTVVTNTIVTKDVIAWLGTATSNSFSTTARLVRVKHFNAETNSTTVEIRDHTNVVDVTAFFENSSSSDVLEKGVVNTVTGVRTGQLFEDLHLVLTNTPPYNLVPHFNVFGFAKVTFVSLTSGSNTLIADNLGALNLAGGGAGTNGVRGLITGSAIITGTVTEVK